MNEPERSDAAASTTHRAASNPSPAASTAPLAPTFTRWARVVRSRLVVGHALSGLAVGAMFGAAGATAGWALRLGPERPWVVGVASVLGVLGALLVARRRRWSDADVALYLDAKLGGHEAVSTAIDAPSGLTPPVRLAVERQARAVLATATRKAVAPRVLRWAHAVAPLALALGTVAAVAPLPPAPPAPPAPPGAKLVKVSDLPGLERLEALDKLQARDPEQAARLKKIAEDARALRAALKQGVEQREALARIAKLRDRVDAERLKLTDKAGRAGLEAAIGAFDKHPDLSKAAKALGDGDLTRFDEEMQRLANGAEADARKEAREALKEAEERARKAGAQALADALKRQQQRFEDSEKKAEAFREFGKQLEQHLDDEGRKALAEHGKNPDPESAKKLAEGMSRALEKLTPEERKALAEKLGRSAEGGQKSGASKDQLRELAKELATPKGQRELAERLRELAKEPPPSEDELRERMLDDAERGGADAQKQLGGVAPTPGGGAPGKQGGSGKDGQSGAGKKGPGGSGKGDGKAGAGGPGSEHDGGTADHKGNTKRLNAAELRAKAQARFDGRAPMLGTTQGRTDARPGETANQAAPKALGRLTPGEVGATDQGDVPEEYREQVGRYFQP